MNKLEAFIIYTSAFLFGVLIYSEFIWCGLLSIPFLLFKQIKFIPLFVFLGLLSFFLRERNLNIPLVNSLEEAKVAGKIEKLYFKGDATRAVIKIPKEGKLIASFKKEESVKIGDELEIEGLLIPLPKKVYPTFYDVEMKNRFLKITGYISVHNYKVLKSKFNILEAVRSYALKTLNRFSNHHYKSIAIALLLGDKGKISGDVYTQFKTAGLAHILAISGLHMSIVIILFFSVIWKILALTPIWETWNTKRISAVLGIMFGLFYLALSSFPVSGVRSFIMVSLIFLTFIIERGASGVRALCIALFIILGLNPEEVLFPSFQLSFSAVLCLLYCYKFRFGENLIINSMIATVTSSFIITIVTMPYVIHHFNYVHFYGVIFNVIAIPLLAIIVMPLALLNLLTGGFAAPAFEYSIGILFKISEVSLHLPFSSIFMKYFNGYLLSFYTFGLILVLCFKGKILKIIGVAIIITTLAVYFITAKNPSIVVNEDYLVVKQGDDYISVFNIPDGFLKEIWMQNLNASLKPYKNSKDLDFTCKNGVCIKDNSFTIIYDDVPKVCTNGIFINIYSDFVNPNCTYSRIILNSDLQKQNPTPFVLY